MADTSLKEKTAKGLLWGGLSNGLVQVINLSVGICLLQLLTPEDYGTVQVLTVFSTIASNLQESGFTAALANKKEPTHRDYNAVFWFNILCGAALYLILFACAPLIADFYNEPVLTPLARFSFLSFLISSWGIAQRAYLFGHLMVKQSSIIFISALVVSGLASIAMAACGLAYWGLAAQGVIFVTVVMLMNWWYSPWRPTLEWDFRPIREMFGFSSKLLVTNLFQQVNRNVFSVLLGRFYGREMTGYYGNASRWNDMGVGTIDSMLAGVAQPTLTQVKNDADRYVQVFRKMLRFTGFVSFPCMLGLGLVAPEFIRLAAGERWMPSVPYLQMLCVYGAFYPVTSLYSKLVISKGKSDVNLFNTVASCLCIWLALYLAHPYGIRTMIVAFVAINVLWLFVWHGFARRLIAFRLRDALKDVLPFLLIAAAVMGVTGWITQAVEPLLLRLAAKMLTAAGLYAGALYLCHAEILRESLAFLLKKKKRT